MCARMFVHECLSRNLVQLPLSGKQSQFYLRPPHLQTMECTVRLGTKFGPGSFRVDRLGPVHSGHF